MCCIYTYIPFRALRICAMPGMEKEKACLVSDNTKIHRFSSHRLSSSATRIVNSRTDILTSRAVSLFSRGDFCPSDVLCQCTKHQFSSESIKTPCAEDPWKQAQRAAAARILARCRVIAIGPMSLEFQVRLSLCLTRRHLTLPLRVLCCLFFATRTADFPNLMIPIAAPRFRQVD